MLLARRIVLVGLPSMWPTEDMVRWSSTSKLLREAAPAAPARAEAKASRTVVALLEAPPSLAPPSLTQLAALRMSCA